MKASLKAGPSRTIAAVNFRFAILVLALAVSACASSAPRRPTLAQALNEPVPIEQLRRDLRELVNASAVDHAHWAIKVASLRDGETIYSLNAFRFMLPASNQKLLTTAVAAERLGWDYQFTTRVLATGPLDPDGTLNGNLVVVSNGDPTINPRHPARWTALDDWAKALQARGIRIVAGDVIGDDNAFAEPGWGIGWTWENLAYGFGTPVGALQYNESQIEVMVGPGGEPGARAIISTSPPGHGLLIDHGVTTVAAGERTTLDIARVPGSLLLQVRGQIAADAKPVTTTAAVENPTRFYMNAFREALARHGIFVSGGAVDVDDLRAPPDLSQATELIVDRSPRLEEIIDVTQKWSRNEYAETLLRALSPEGKPATSEAGLEVLREQLRVWGLPREYYQASDGSGLSRTSFVTAEALSGLLTYIWADPKHADLFRGTLPVAGVSGTLAERLKGTPAEKRVWAKTGSLSGVRTLSGYIVTLAGEPLVFSILANNYRVPTAEIDGIVDKALIKLVEFRR